MKNGSWEQAVAAFDVECESLKATKDVIDKEAFAQAVDVLRSAGRIGSAGCGHTGISCMHFAHLMSCIERPARFISPSEGVHGAMGYIQKGDVLVLASRGGKTKELIPMMEIAKGKGATVISVTENLESPLAEGSDIVLQVKITREADKYNSQGTSSFAVVNAVFDALQTALVEETGYKNEQFAVIHPGGAVGERLNRRPL